MCKIGEVVRTIDKVNSIRLEVVAVLFHTQGWCQEFPDMGGEGLGAGKCIIFFWK